MPQARSNTSHLTLDAQQARQAGFGRRLFWVLVASTFLAAVVVFAAWMWRAPQSDAGSTHQPSQAPKTFHMGEPVVQQRQTTPDAATPSHP